MTVVLALIAAGLAIANLIPSTAAYWQIPVAVLLMCAAVFVE